MKTIRPSIIAQRTTSLVTGRQHARVQRYSRVDASAVRRPVGIGAVHVHSAAVALQNSRVLTTRELTDLSGIPASWRK